MANVCTQRLLKELSEIQKEEQKIKQTGGTVDICVHPNQENILCWTGYIIGPTDSPFENGKFEIEIRVPANYPMAAPTVRFITKIFHPNIHSKTGEVCLDILKKSWTPAWTIQSVCRAVITLLSHPEPDSPLNCDAGNLMRCGDLRGFKSLAKMYTKLYAK
eukprot:c614_g1_i1.p1 GENE.c614_g1_i1~~c614_g1_i1.p1  ORF type:complete len:168 (+),score=51.48 c614_g1_i1:23-505(+)